MSWDVVLFNSRQRITDPEHIDEGQLEPIDFGGILSAHFPHIVIDGDHRSIQEPGYTIEYSHSTEWTSNILLFLYGEHALFALIVLAKQYDWQVFDTSLGAMIDLDNPERNGYKNFQQYIRSITGDTTA